MSCCRPQVKVIASSIVAGTSVTLTINRNFTSIGRNSDFCLCVPLGFIPTQIQDLADPILIADPAGSIYPAKVSCSGNNLHIDQLRTFLLRNVCGKCHSNHRCFGRLINGCCAHNFNCFFGFDDPHVTFCHRFCPSIVGTAALADDIDPGPPGLL